MKKILLSHSRIYSGSLILVNSKYSFSQHAPDVLTSVGRQKDILMERQAAVLLDKLMSEINGWDFIVPVSGYRPFEEQQKIWDDTVKTDGIEFARKYVAYPGHSEHQTGLAIDLGLKQEKIDFICPEFPYQGICQKFRELAADYGFIERYPSEKEAVTGIGHEPWHFRYVGKGHASYIMENNLCLEEYIELLQNHTYQNPLTFEYDSTSYGVFWFNEDEIPYTAFIPDGYQYNISSDNCGGVIVTYFKKN